MTSHSRIALFGLVGVLLSACAMGPNYQEPSFDFSNWWHSAKKSDAPAAPTQSPSMAWWEAFHDDKLNDLVKRALANNQDLKIAEARIAEARGARQATGSALFPQIGGKASTQSAREIMFGDQSITPRNYSAVLDATWEVDLFGTTQRAVESADATIQARQADLRAARITLIGDVARNYIEWRQLQQQIVLTQETAKAQQELYGIANTKYKAGTGSYLEASEAQTLYKNTMASLPELERQRDGSGYRLSVLLGETAGPLNNELKAVKKLPQPIAVPVLSAPADTIRGRPDVQAAERELASASALKAEAFTELFPKLSLSGFFGINGARLSQSTRTWSVTSGLTVPLLNFGRLQGDIKAADAHQTQALAVYRKTVLQAISDVETSLTNVSKADTRTTLLRDAVKSAKLTLDIAKDRYSNGLATFTEVLDSEKQLYSAQATSVQAQSDLLMYLIALHKALAISQ